jgi:hypothetical protein
MKMPTLVVVKKKMLAEGEMPDYSGPGYNEARRTVMLEADGGRRARVAELDDIACQLDQAVKMHSEQAERLRALADEICRDGEKQGYDGHG